MSLVIFSDFCHHIITLLLYICQYITKQHVRFSTGKKNLKGKDFFFQLEKRI